MQMNKIRIIAGLALGAGLLAIMPQATFARDKNKHAQNVIVTVDGQGYHPAAINVKAGQEVHLTFVSKSASCANGFSIPALKQTVTLKKGQKKEITFTPKKGQVIGFACNMKMFKGTITTK